MEDDTRQLFVSDIVDAPYAVSAIDDDNAQYLRALSDGDPAEQQAAQVIASLQAQARIMSLDVLERLEDLGVEDAKILTGKLEELENERSSTGDMISVASLLLAESGATEDETKQDELQRLGSLALSVATIATARAAALIIDGDTEQSDLLLDYVHRNIDMYTHVVPHSTHEALIKIINEAGLT